VVSVSEQEQLAQVLTLHKPERSDLVSLLLDVQHKLGYLPKEALLAIAEYLRISPNVVYGVATFYNEFRLTPLGKNHVKVCMGTACHLQRGELVLDAAKRELEVEVGGATPDLQFSLDRVACVGCCSLAPVLVVNGTVYPKMTTTKVEEILSLVKRDEGKGGDQTQ
jgi:NADH:ubiquinone oxidoreductase subunit E